MEIEEISKYMNNPIFQKIPESFTHEVEIKSKICGDRGHIWAKVCENGKIQEIGYEHSGCAVNVVAFEILCQKIIDCGEINSNLLNTLPFQNEKKMSCIKLALDTISLLKEEIEKTQI